MIFWFFYKNEMLPNTSIATDVLPNNIAFPRLMRYIFYFGLPKSDKLLVLFWHWDAPVLFFINIAIRINFQRSIGKVALSQIAN